MKKILLFSDHREIFKTTSKITKGKYKLKWCTYDWLNDDKHFTPDVIIMYFNKKMGKAFKQNKERVLSRFSTGLRQQIPYFIR